MELVIPAPVDYSGNVECLTNPGAAKAGDQVLMVMPGGEDFGSGLDR